ncbi:gustatory and pheromone receptor 32a [Monomorium pharaonis]|uniref:gustatory and pheromone receptor 32a n=1 Tax=Monomorium pharaonis TaxID=307658 RepID=UPI00102E1258|nr:gustatory and pheromone receptor 32a [Monomorium pharaonis]
MEAKIHVQVEDYSSSIEYILRPILYTSWFFGAGVACPRKCSKAITIIIRIVHLAVCSFSVTYSVFDFSNFDTAMATDSDIYKFMYCMNKAMCYVSAYYYIYQGIRHYNKWPTLMDRMNKLDQKIRSETPLNNRTVKNLMVLAILATFACCPLSLITHAVYYYFKYPEYVFVSDLLFYYMLAQSLINSFVFDVIVYVLYHRFRVINELISQMDEMFGASWIALKIRRTREFHNGICDIIIVLNDIHSFHLLLCSVNCFTVVVSTLFKVYMNVVEKNFAFTLVYIILCITYIVQFGLMCWICTLARQESERTGIIIYTFALNYKNLNQDRVRNEVNDFSIQLQQHRVAFTACNFFEISNALLSGFIGVISAYLIILIQFYQPPKEGSSMSIHGVSVLNMNSANYDEIPSLFHSSSLETNSSSSYYNVSQSHYDYFMNYNMI